MYKLFLVLFFSFALGSSFVYAQTSAPANSMPVEIPEAPALEVPSIPTIDPISFSLVPETPGPGQSVTITIESSSLDLDNAIISWKVNGSTLQTGKGLKRISVTNGPQDSQTTITVDISSGGATISRSVSFGASEIDLLWQGETYAPPFYKGRHLWTHGSRITLVAIPHVNLSSPGSLIYRWTQNGTVLGSSSGAGKNSISFSDSVLSLPQEITVDVMTDQDTVVATKTLRMQAGEVSTLLYEDNPLIGLILNREVDGSYSLKEKEISFSAMPLFFGVNKRNDSRIKYSWSTNNGSSESGSRITLRTPDNSSGQARVGVSINNSANILQSSSKNFLVKFGNDIQF